MGDDDKHPAYRDTTLATMYRLDPDKLAAIRRSMTGMTRCPNCDELNRADQKKCDKCGAYLYPDMAEDEEAEQPVNEEEVRHDDKPFRAEENYEGDESKRKWFRKRTKK